MNILEIAESVGAYLNEDNDLVFTDPEHRIQAFADALTKEKDAEIEKLEAEYEEYMKSKVEEIERFKHIEERVLQVLLPAKTSEIERYKAEMNLLRTEVLLGEEQVEQLNAKVAMMRDALEYHQEQTRPISKTQDALSATEQDVTRWVNGVKADALESLAEQCYWNEDAGDWQMNKDEIVFYAKQLRGEVCNQCHGLGYYDEGHENDDGSMSGGNYVACEKCKPVRGVNES